MLAGDVADADGIAVRFIAEFGSISAVLAASEARQLRVSGGDRRAIVALSRFRVTMLQVLRERIATGCVLSSWQELLDYLHADMAGAIVERVRILHLDAANHLIRDELVSEGTIDEAEIHVREVIRRALELGSAAIILVHNHPSGSDRPSRADINITRRISEAGRLFGITLHDHLIIAGSEHVSLRARGLMF